MHNLSLSLLSWYVYFVQLVQLVAAWDKSFLYLCERKIKHSQYVDIFYYLYPEFRRQEISVLPASERWSRWFCYECVHVHTLTNAPWMIATNAIPNIMSESITRVAFMVCVHFLLATGMKLESMDITDFNYDQLMNITLTVRSHVCMRTHNIHNQHFYAVYVGTLCRIQRTLCEDDHRPMQSYAQMITYIPTITCR